MSKSSKTKLLLMYGSATSLLFLTIAINWYPNREGLQDRQVRQKLESAHQLGWYYADRGEFNKASEIFRESLIWVRKNWVFGTL